MPSVSFRADRCKGCKLCIQVCPKQIIEIDRSIINQKGFYAVCVTDKEKCTGCAFCATICPDTAIEVEE